MQMNPYMLAKFEDWDLTQVSLGGKGRGKAAESKHEFLERTRKEREERETQRRREKSSLKLQVWDFLIKRFGCHIGLACHIGEMDAFVYRLSSEVGGSRWHTEHLKGRDGTRLSRTWRLCGLHNNQMP